MSDLIGKRLRKVLDEFGEELVLSVRAELMSKGKVATGHLIDSLKYQISEQDDEVQVLLYYADYFPFVDQGRQPTKNGGSGELRSKIEDWIRVKGIVPKPDSKGKLPTIKQLSFLISRKIHNEGFKGTPILENVINALYLKYQYRIQEALEDDYSELVLTKVEYLLGRLFE